MQLVQFGTTPLGVTRIGIGLAAVGRPGYINLGHDADLGSNKSVEALEAQAHRLLDAAWTAGIRYFDAARSYGRAEAFLQSWLAARDLKPGAVSIGSKWGYRYTANWQVEAEAHEIKEHTRAHFEAQLAETRAHLGEHLGLYQVHSAKTDSGVFNDDVLDALARLRDQGTVIGLSLSGARQGETLARALEVERGEQPLFRSVQATWNLLERSVAPELAEAQRRGWGVILKEVVANGRLTYRHAANAVTPLRELAERASVGIDAIATAAALRQPFATVVLSGAARVDHLESNLRALTVPDAVADASLAAVEPEAPEAYWDTRAQLAWN